MAANSQGFLQSGAEGFSGDGVTGGDNFSILVGVRLAPVISGAFSGGRIVECLGTSEME